VAEVAAVVVEQQQPRQLNPVAIRATIFAITITNVVLGFVS